VSSEETPEEEEKEEPAAEEAWEEEVFSEETTFSEDDVEFSPAELLEDELLLFWQEAKEITIPNSKKLMSAFFIVFLHI
jgi:hypothetical protein